MVEFTDAKDVSAEIVKQFNPLLVTLFGSVARKTSGNDLDILVVVEDRDDYQGEKTDSLLQCSLAKYYHRFDIAPFVLPGSKYLNQLSDPARQMRTPC